MSLRIGILHYTALPVVGGVETVVDQHARHLAAAGHRVRIIVGRGGRPGPGVDVIRLPLLDTRAPKVRAAQDALDRGEMPPSAAALVDELVVRLREATSGLDVLVAHNACSLNVHVPLTAALARVVREHPTPRLVAWSHDVAATAPHRRARLHPGDPWDLYRSAWPGVTQVVVSEARRAELAAATGITPGSIRVVPNGIDLDAMRGLRPASRDLVEALDLDRAWPLLFTPARLVPRKNLELVVRVVGALRAEGDDARAVITGEPDPHDRDAAGHLARLRAVARETGAEAGVHLLVDGPRAWRTPATIADLYRVADLLMFPSRDEGFGLPVLEAAACRLPVVCADIAALREIAGTDATYVDPSAEPAAVASIVRSRLASDPADRLRRRVRAPYRWRVIVSERVEPLLRRVARGD